MNKQELLMSPMCPYCNSIKKYYEEIFKNKQHKKRLKCDNCNKIYECKSTVKIQLFYSVKKIKELL